MNEANRLERYSQRFLRSTDVERDWYDPSALENYTFTKTAEEALFRLSLGLQNSSSLRSWRITGDYGSGKSSFALLVANIFSKRASKIPQELKISLSESFPGLFKGRQSKLTPLLVTGSREHLGKVILRRLLETLTETGVHGNFLRKLEDLLNSSSNPDDESVLFWLKKSHEYLVSNNESNGILLMIDEAGKFLEYAASTTDSRDIYLLQRIAEFASRTKASPFYIVVILHQGIASYSDNLSKNEQKEWEKIAGRFEEIVWHYPVEQSTVLIGSALSSASQIPKQTNLKAVSDMKAIIKAGWFGIAANKNALNSLSEEVYPLHPTVIPVLIKLFSMFGQNERSLYSFLLGDEPFGLQDFLSKEKRSFFRLHNLYDYAKNTFGNRLGTYSYHWKAINATVSINFSLENDVSNHLLKSIGIINLINSDDIVASEEIVKIAVEGVSDATIKKLLEKNIIHYRGVAGGYCVWPNTSVNIDSIYTEAKKVLGNSTSLKDFIKNRIDQRPVVARRHYIETGTLRYFEIKYIPFNELGIDIQKGEDADGEIIVVICESKAEVEKALPIAKKHSDKSNRVIVVPPPFTEILVLVDEVKRWEWIEKYTPELRHDLYAREEVARRLSVSNLELQGVLQSAIGLTSLEINKDLKWFYQGKLVPNLRSGKQVMAYLADIFDSLYHRAPKINNELINRRFLSGAGALARLKLISLILEHSDKPLLGMDESSHPPEMSMYLSVLKQAGLHQKSTLGDFWEIVLPNEDLDDRNLRVLPVMRYIHELLSGRVDKRVPVLDLFAYLKQPPYGVREGLIPLFLSLFSVIHEQELAFYEDGTFFSRLTSSNFHRLIKAPETFDIQYYPINSVRSSLFSMLLDGLGLSDAKQSKAQILDVVKSLFGFMGGLPEYVMQTNSLSPSTLEVRRVLQQAKDPIQLLFNDLPIACGFDSIKAEHNDSSENVFAFVKTLRESIDELRGAYPKLLFQIEGAISKEFEFSDSFERMQEHLGERAKALSAFVTEIKLKGFCLRLADSNLPKEAWLEAMGNFLCSMPVPKWKDKDVFKYMQEIHNLTKQFLRVEATLYKKDEISSIGHSVRVALTRPNGEEKDQVIHLINSEVENFNALTVELREILKSHGKLGVIAASEVLWEMINNDTTE